MKMILRHIISLSRRMGLWTPVWRAAVKEDVNIVHLEEVGQRAGA